MKISSLADYWIHFRNNCIPTNAGKQQITEMRRAFYAGAFALRTLFEGQPENDAEAEKDTIRLSREIDQFFQNVKERKC